MTVNQTYDRVINWFSHTGLTAGVGTGIAIIVVAALLLALGRFRRFARGLGIVGLLVVMAFVWVVHEQTVTEKQGPRITVTTSRYPPQVRRVTSGLLLVLPTVAAVVMSWVLVSTQRRLRAQVTRHLREGRRHLVKKDYGAALKEYNLAIETSPENAEAYFRRGAVLQAMGDLEHALEDFDRAIEHDPRLAPAYLQRGKLHTEQGNLDQALADFGQLMSFRANDAESYLHRGICLLKKGQLRDAAADFQRVLKLTNHTDFAEPAKKYLRECEGPVLPSASLPEPGGNGAPAARAARDTTAEESHS